MKKIFILICAFLAISNLVLSQDTGTQKTTSFNMGIGGGIEHFNGLVGLNAEFQTNSKLLFCGTVGLGGWGVKSSLGARYFLKNEKGFNLGIFVAYSSGMKQTYKLTTATDDYDLNLKPVIEPILVLSYRLPVGARVILNFDLDYGRSFPSKPYTEINNKVLDNVSLLALNIQKPGGIGFGGGFLFRLM